MQGVEGGCSKGCRQRAQGLQRELRRAGCASASAQPAMPHPHPPGPAPAVLPLESIGDSPAGEAGALAGLEAALGLLCGQLALSTAAAAAVLRRSPSLLHRRPDDETLQRLQVCRRAGAGVRMSCWVGGLRRPGRCSSCRRVVWAGCLARTLPGVVWKARAPAPPAVWTEPPMPRKLHLTPHRQDLLGGRAELAAAVQRQPRLLSYSAEALQRRLQVLALHLHRDPAAAAAAVARNPALLGEAEDVLARNARCAGRWCGWGRAPGAPAGHAPHHASTGCMPWLLPARPPGPTRISCCKQGARPPTPPEQVLGRAAAGAAL